jgi:hypothetical protein
MKNVRTMIMSAVLVAAAAASGHAQANSTATQDITIDIQAINRIAVDGGAQTVTFGASSVVTPGQSPDDQTISTTWAVTTNQPNTKVTAGIATAITGGVTLKVNMAGPTGASGGTDVALTDGADHDVVTGINKQAQSGMALTYKVSAPVSAGVTSITRTVTYTVVGGV